MNNTEKKLRYLFKPLIGQSPANLLERAQQLKETDETGYAIGEVIERLVGEIIPIMQGPKELTNTKEI